MSQRSERDLRNSLVLNREHLWEGRENMPWPTAGDVLLDPAVGSEQFIYSYGEWLPDDLARLGLFAQQYQDCARELVRAWVKSPVPPENITYVVGFLYRHALELNLKAIITRSAWFPSLDLAQQRKVLQVHSLGCLWSKARRLLADVCDAGEIDIVEKQILEVHQLDTGSDGFRYPFGFRDRSGNRKRLLEGLVYSSFDNFVWILDGLNSWLGMTEDLEDRHEEW